MRALSSLGTILGAVLAVAACTPGGDDGVGTCVPRTCAIAQCASLGYAGGHCDGVSHRCVCDGEPDPSGRCVDGSCNSACRAYAGADSGSCRSGVCECSGGTDAGTDDGDTWIPPGRASATGVVMGPGSVFPVSGAVVYAERSATSVDAIPEGNYCPRCLDLTSRPNTLSGPDGSFRLSGLGVGDWALIVQKGQFRRVRQITISGETEVLSVPPDYTTLPNRHDPGNGDTIPKIAVALGSYDDMEDILAKVHLATLTYDYHADLEDVSNLTFDIYDNGGGGWGSATRPFGDLITNPSLMAQYQIIFVPCSSSGNDSYLDDPTVRENIRQWVNAGGKWYVADWSYDWVEQVFPDYLDFQGEDSIMGEADSASSSYDGRGRVVDADMAAWLNALGDSPTSVIFEEIWDNVDALGSVSATDEDGTPITIVPKTWAEGNHEHPDSAGPFPYTVTFPYGCGRVLFTTYHTVGDMGGEGRAELLAQEKILLYLIMEIGVCTDQVIIY